MTKRKIAIALALVLAGAGAVWIGANWGIEQTDDAQLQSHLYPVSSRILGTVDTVLVDAHDAVLPGQPLVLLDSDDQRMQVLRAEADLSSARRQADAAHVTVAADRSDASAGASQARGDQLDARAEVVRTAADLKRYQSLHRQGAATQQQVDLAQSQYQQSLGRLSRSSGSQAIVRSRQARIQVDTSKAAAAQAEVLQAQAALAAAKLQLSYTTLRAPAAAVVGQRQVEAGQGVQPGQGLLTLVGKDVWVEANFKETQVGPMRVGNRVDLHLDGVPGVVFHGHVTSLSPASGARFALLPPDNATGNFTKVVQRVTVRIDFDPSSLGAWKSRLKPGLSVVTSVHT
ncbi:MAG: HlyD family secretion protein [Cyanobacteria bacterium]|nr:HlyD family secretion protein [Cyanobacteriota bacterium]